MVISRSMPLCTTDSSTPTASRALVHGTRTKPEDAACALKVSCGRRAFVFRQQFLGQLVTSKVLADELLLFSGSGKHCATAVDDKNLCPRTLCRTGCKLADPPQVEGCDDHRRCDPAPFLHHRECSHHAQNAADPSDEIVAQRKLARMQGILEIRAVGNIQSD